MQKELSKIERDNKAAPNRIMLPELYEKQGKLMLNVSPFPTRFQKPRRWRNHVPILAYDFTPRCQSCK